MKKTNGILSIMILIFLSAYCSDVSTVSGNVYDYDTGEPLSGADVTLCFSADAPCSDKTADDIDISDEKGRYSVKADDAAAAGTYNSITVSKNGYIPFSGNLDRIKDYDLSIYLKRE